MYEVSFHVKSTNEWWLLSEFGSAAPAIAVACNFHGYSGSTCVVRRKTNRGAYVYWLSK